MYSAAGSKLEKAAGHWPFSDQFQHIRMYVYSQSKSIFVAQIYSTFQWPPNILVIRYAFTVSSLSSLMLAILSRSLSVHCRVAGRTTSRNIQHNYYAHHKHMHTYAGIISRK